MFNLNVVAGPNIKLLDSQTADLGRFPARVKQEANFRLKNTGDEALKIIRIRKTCGCFEVSCDLELLPPEATATVKVTLLPDSVHAPFTKSVFVESSDPTTPRLRLNVSGNAVPLIRVRPKAKLSVGKLRTLGTWRQAFLLSASETDVILGEPTVAGTHELATELMVEPGKPGSQRLVLRSVGELAAGHFKCTVTVPVLKPADSRAVEIVVYGEVLAGQP